MNITLTDGTIQLSEGRDGRTDVLIFDPAGLAWSMVDHMDDDEYDALMIEHPVEGTYCSDLLSGTEEQFMELFAGITTLDEALEAVFG